MQSAELQHLKYSDLQKLAKSHGIKANQKGDKLIEALKSIIDCEDATKQETDHANDSKEIVNESKLGVDVENQKSASKKRRSLTVVITKVEHDAAKKTLNEHHVSTPGSNKKSPFDSLSGSTSPKKTSSTKKRTPTVETIKAPEIPQISSANKSRRSSQRLDILSEKQETEKCLPDKKRQREISESEEQLEPMRKRLRSSLESKEAENNEDDAKQSTNIPRYSKLLKMKKKTAEYWSKMHQKNQDRMESIDEYQTKRQNRAALLLSGRKEKNKVATGLKGLDNRRSPRLTAVVKPLTSKIFVPEVLTVDTMDLNFGKKASAAQKNSAAKKLQNNTFIAEMSPGFKTPKNQKLIPGKNVGSNLKDSMFSPKPTNTSMMSASKPKFNLVASLERPLTWVPHKGKIKPVEEGTSRYRVDVKEVKIRSKKERMAESQSGWKSKRSSELMRKRNMK